MKSILVVLLALVAFLNPARAEETLNRDMNIVIVQEDGSPADRIVSAFANARVTQALVSIPEAQNPGGRMLDPNSVRVQWNGKELETFVYYKVPQLALLFVLHDEDLLRDEAEGLLTMEAGFLGEEEMAAGWQLPVTITDEAFTSRTIALERGGRAVRIADADGQPIANARLFGQRRADMLAAANAEGIVYLDAASRNTPGDHYAFAEGYWTTGFDPITTPEVVLHPRTEESTRRVQVRFNADEEAAPEKALLLVDNTYYTTLENGEGTVELLAFREGEVLLLLPGRLPLRAVSVAGEETLEITLSAD